MTAYTGAACSNGRITQAVQPVQHVWVASASLTGRSYTVGYDDGLSDGYNDGFSDGQMQEVDMKPIKPGETDNDKKTIYLRIYDEDNLPASGEIGEGAVCFPSASEKQVNRDLAGYTNAAGTFNHVGDGLYSYVFDNAEVSEAGGEGTTLFRVKSTGFKTATVSVPINYGNVDTIQSAAVTSIQSGLATSSALASVASAVVDVDGDIAAMQSDVDAIASSTSGLDAKLGTPAGASISDDISGVRGVADSIQTTTADLHKVEFGRWKIADNQLTLYDVDGETPIKVFDLVDDEQVPSMTRIFERLPVA